MSLAVSDVQMLRKRNGIKALYLGKCSVNEATKIFGVDAKKECLSIANELLKFHPDLHENSFALNRLISESLGIAIIGHQQYTEEEIKLAFTAHVFQTMKLDVILKTYGVPQKTLNNKRPKLLKLLHIQTKPQLTSLCHEHPAKVHSAIASMQLRGVTSEPYLTESEAGLYCLMANKRDEAGAGLSVQRFTKKIRLGIHEKGKQIIEDATAVGDFKMAQKGQRMLETPVTVSTGSRIARKFGAPLSESSGNSKRDHKLFKKTSPVSLKRAAAANPLLALAMYKMIREQFQKDFEDGLIDSPEPRADQLWNGDEIGVPPNGRHVATFTLGRGQRRGFWLVTGEKSPFWLTMLWASRADGITSDPMVVHQGGTETTMPASFVEGLPGNFCIHSTASGYIDQVGFRGWVDAFVAQSGARVGNFQYLFMDGHDSHWDYIAISYMLERSVRMIFLKSNDSINDQPQDNGMNACFKAHYAEAYDDWLEAHPTLQYTPSWMNLVLTEAWRSYTSDQRLPTIIQKAFAKTGLHPLVCLAQGHTEQALQNASMAEIFVTDKSDQRALKRLKTECTESLNHQKLQDHHHRAGRVAQVAPQRGIDLMARCIDSDSDSEWSDARSVSDSEEEDTELLAIDAESSGVAASQPIGLSSSSSSSAPESSLFRPIVIAPEPHQYYEEKALMSVVSLPHQVTPTSDPVMFKVVVSKAIMDALHKSWVEPAQDVLEKVQKFNESKKIHVAKGALLSCVYPSTKTGLSVTVESTLKDIKQVSDNRAAKAAEEAAAAAMRAEEKLKRAVIFAQLRQQFLNDVNSLGEEWKKKYTKRDDLWSVFKALGGEGASAQFKVKDLAPAIDRILNDI